MRSAIGQLAVQLAVVAVAVVGLWVGARLLVDAVVRLARRFGLSDLTVGLTVVAMGTSTPELSVTIDAALKGLGDLGVGNLLGSNIYNLAFILGVVSLVRVIPVASSLVRRDGLALLASTAVGGVVLLDLSVTRAEGTALALAFVAYTGYLLHTGTAVTDASDGMTGANTSGGVEITREITERVQFRGRDGALLVVGLAIVLVSGDALVAAASGLARGAGVTEWVIGGTIVAAGTSTPEFAVSLVALRRGSLGVSVGNVVGSNVFNAVAIVGVAAVIRPLTVSPAALETLAWLAVVSVAMVTAMWTGRVLSRAEGALFACSEVLRWTLGLLGRFG
ncbi:calcium/sodium antiporter [Halobaculum halobium]|uniref:Calcium/sodium antiporter n=1 Tax=Halobaculum halobium TaxID=3032281 RepID=A0ABD5TK28_9EURY|nr:calcium/sodium antiporter [Halobaculum sp. SYNS20]